MFQGADDLLAYVKDEGVQFIDIRFCDLPGIMSVVFLQVLVRILHREYKVFERRMGTHVPDETEMGLATVETSESPE